MRRNPPPGGMMPGDSARPGMGQGMMGPDGQGGPGDPRAMEMRQRVEARFGQMVQQELQLSDQDMQHVRESMRANQDRRVAFMRREQDMRRAIQAQLQPGQAANNDSVARMTEAMGHLRVERAQSDEQMVRDLGFLPPVKRARLLNMMQRFEQRVQEIRQRSMMGARRGMMR